MAGSEMVWRLEAIRRLKDLQAASGCPNINKPIHSLGPSPEGGDGGRRGTGGRYSLLADEDVLMEVQPREGTTRGMMVKEDSGEESE